jgi:hypothetical protein
MRTVVVGLLALLPAVAGAKEIKPRVQWTAVNEDAKLATQAPKAGYFSEAAGFEKLWKAWRPKDDVPMVDFGRELVLVSTAGGPNAPKVQIDLGDDGDLKVRSQATLLGGDGFGYTIAVIPRAGVKTVGGQPLK